MAGWVLQNHSCDWRCRQKILIDGGQCQVCDQEKEIWRYELAQKEHWRQIASRLESFLSLGWHHKWELGQSVGCILQKCLTLCEGGIWLVPMQLLGRCKFFDLVHVSD
jgi:hypothetical protein